MQEPGPLPFKDAPVTEVLTRRLSAAYFILGKLAMAMNAATFGE